VGSKLPQEMAKNCSMVLKHYDSIAEKVPAFKEMISHEEFYGTSIMMQNRNFLPKTVTPMGTELLIPLFDMCNHASER
jgi:hypothetical protein